MSSFTFADLFPTFTDTSINKEDLEDLIKKAIERNLGKKIKEIAYNKNGVTVKLLTDEIIEIEINWEEFILEGI